MMRAFVAVLISSTLLLIGAPMAEASPLDFAAMEDAVGTQICHLLDSGVSGPQVYAQLQKDWAQFDKILQNEMGGDAPDRRTFVKQAVATKCPRHASKVAGI